MQEKRTMRVPKACIGNSGQLLLARRKYHVGIPHARSENRRGRMNKLKLFLAAIFLLGPQWVAAQTAVPLKLATKYDMPAAVKGRFDHLGIDIGGNRLFVVGAEAHKVLVFYLYT